MVSTRYSLRVLLCGVAGAAIAAFFLRMDVQRFKAAALIQRELTATGAAFGLRRVRPAWASNILGPDYGNSVTALRIGSEENGSVDQVVLSRRLAASATTMPRLEYLCICNARIDAGPLKLQGLPLLRGLSLGGSDVTDVSLAQLGALKDLQTLDLSATRIGDGALRHIKSLAHLRFLGLSATAVSDDGIALLANHESLQYLQLNATAITDASVPSLASMRALRVVEIDQTRVTANGRRHLQMRLPQVRYCLYEYCAEDGAAP